MFFVFLSFSLSFSLHSLSLPVSLSLSPLDVHCKNSSFVCNIASFFFFIRTEVVWENGHFILMLSLFLVLESLSLLPSLSLSPFHLSTQGE